MAGAARVLATLRVSARVFHADGTVTDLGDISGRLTFKQWRTLREMRKRQRKAD